METKEQAQMVQNFFWSQGFKAASFRSTQGTYFVVISLSNRQVTETEVDWVLETSDDFYFLESVRYGNEVRVW